MALRILIAVLTTAALGFAEKMTDEDRLKLIRGLTAEFANTKIAIPRAKKALPVKAQGAGQQATVEQAKWNEAMTENGPAAKPGDQVQITKVDVNGDNIVLQLNGGFKNGRSWRDRIQVSGGVGMRQTPIGGTSNISLGTTIVLEFGRPLEPMEAMEVKKMLTSVFAFDIHSVTENLLENLPPQIATAIKENKAVEGMDREQVKMSLGQPRYKSRETKDGMELEDWVYGQAPGKITFVTFNGSKVMKVRETYAGLGGEAAKP